MVLAAVGVMLTLLPTATWQQYAIVPIITSGIGMASATITALVSNSAGPEVQGEVLGINASLQALAQALPPLVAGFAAARFGIELPIVLASVVVIIGAIVFTTTYKPVVFHGEGI
jgi:MFS family permease